MAQAPDTRTRIVEAAAHRLGTLGPEAVTTRGVAEDARVQAPTIYRLFGDKDGLLEAVAEHVLDQFVAAKSAVVDDADAAELDAVEDLRAGWHSQVEFALAHPAVFRLLLDSDPARTSPALLRGREVLARRVRRVAAQGRLRVSEERAAEVVQAAGVGTVQVLLASPPDQRDPELSETVLEAVLARILVDAPARDTRDDDQRAVVHAFRAVVPDLEGLTDAERALLAQWLERIVS